MPLSDFIQLALRAIAGQRLRSFLTLLGIAVGIAAVILLTSIGEGIHRFVLAEFTQFGTNVIGVHPGRTKTGGAGMVGFPTSARPLTLDDAAALARLPHVQAVTPSLFGNAEVNANGRSRRTSIYGVGPDMPVVFKGTVRIGQFLPVEDAGSARALVVLGPKLKHEIFGADNALGQRVRIGGLQFRVIGVMEPKGQFLGIDLDDTAFIPAGRAMELFNREGLNEIDVAVAEGASSAQVVEQIRRLMSARHGREGPLANLRVRAKMAHLNSAHCWRAKAKWPYFAHAEADLGHRLGGAKSALERYARHGSCCATNKTSANNRPARHSSHATTNRF